MTEQTSAAVADQADSATDTGDAEVSATTAFGYRLLRVVGSVVAVPVAVGWTLGWTAAGADPWPASVLLLIALAFTTWRWAVGRTSVSSQVSAAALELGICCWIVLMGAEGPGWGWLAVGTLAGGVALLSEQPLVRLSTIFVPLVANLPGVAPAPVPVDLARPTRVVRTALLTVGLLVGVGLAPAPVWAVAGLGLLVLPATTGVRNLQRLLAGRRINRALPGALVAYAPEFVVYTSRPDAAAYQVTMWLPYLERVGRPFVIIARTNAAAADIAANTDLPVITRQGAGDLEACLTDSLRAVFYVNASSGNGAFVRYGQLTHVYLGHGDSDKPPSYNPTHAMYDRVFAAGPAAIERYGAHGVDIPRDKFDIVGRPQVEGVEQARPGPPQVALYAPTWRGHVAETMLYSLPSGVQIVARLLARGLTVIFRPHPFSYDFDADAGTVRRIQDLLAADAAATGRPHLYGAAAETERGIVDCINASDLMVSDVSSVVSDYLFSGKPFALVAVPTDPVTFRADYPVAAAAYVVAADLSDLDAALGEMLGADPGRDARIAVRRDYLGDFPAATYAQGFVDACRRVITGPRGRAGEVDDSADEQRRGSSLIRRIRSQFAAYGRDLATAFAALVVIVALAGGAQIAAAILGSLLLATIAFVSRRVVTGRSSANRVLGTAVLARVLLALATIVIWIQWWSTSGRAEPLWAALAGGLLMLLTMCELPLRGAWAGPGAGVRNLAGLDGGLETGPPRGTLAAASVGQLVLSWVLALIGVHPVAALPTLIGCLVLFVVLLRSARRRLREVDRVRTELRELLIDYRPEFAVYFGSTMGADYQVGMWLPYFRRIGARFVIITRSAPMMNVLAQLAEDVPVIFRPTLRSLEDVVVPSMTTCFYVNNAVRNTHFIERRELTHVWLNHGDSEKPACYNPVHAIYDLIFSAGQAGIDRYARHGVEIAGSKFRVVGRPQVEQIVHARGSVGDLRDRTVLYAPTWRGPYADSRVYSLPRGRQIVAALLDRGVRVVFRAHPFNRRFPDSQAMIREIERLLATDAKATGRQHLYGVTAHQEMSVEDCFNASDAMVADVSAVVSDYLKSDKPFAVVSVGRTPQELTAMMPAAEAGYVLTDDLGNLDAVLDDLLDADPLADVRHRFRQYYLGDFADDGYADGFLDAARTVIHADGPGPT